ncbi:Calcium-dependent secretion activator 2 [Taenia crassiceps]|uniref:Calcium-dependent secretion activator 2 n=1 Tax=Taenia crassiceps TaxID=6207 RepID=A0ABR4QG65_9CEST
MLKCMDSLYTEELRGMVNELMIRLESVPVTKGGGSFQKFKKHGRNQSLGSSLRDHSTEESPELNLSKVDTQLNFTLEAPKRAGAGAGARARALTLALESSDSSVCHICVMQHRKRQGRLDRSDGYSALPMLRLPIMLQLCIVFSLRSLNHSWCHSVNHLCFAAHAMKGNLQVLTNVRPMNTPLKRCQTSTETLIHLLPASTSLAANCLHAAAFDGGSCSTASLLTICMH